MTSVDDPGKVCYWFDRDIERLTSFANDQKARDYMDIFGTNSGTDPELKSKLAFLRDSQLSRMVGIFALY